jgi:hypothetical protein
MLKWRLIPVVLFTCALAAAQGGHKFGRHKESQEIAAEADALRSVLDYCQMDSRGERLNSGSGGLIRELTTWQEPPEFQFLSVISSFRVVSTKLAGEKAKVTVVYDVMGRFEIGIGYFAEPHSETATFELQRYGASWKIDSIERYSNPHVLRQRVVSWLSQEMNREKDPAFKAKLQQALVQLREPGSGAPSQSQK